MNKKKQIIIVLVVILIAVGLYAVMNTMTAIENTSPIAKNENIETITSIAKLIMIPDEKPVIATINEADKLVLSQPFYSGSSNGDKLVIFPNAKKAIIYSPSKNIIVNAGPFKIGDGPVNQ